MTWPTGSIPTTNLDAAADSPASARADLLTMAQQINLMRAWIGGDEVSLAVSGTVDIGGQTSNRIVLGSGSGAITSLGSNYGGPVFVRAGVACSLTYNATTLVTPNGASITLRVGDSFMAIPKASGGASNGWFIVPGAWVGRLGLLGAVPSAYSSLTLGATGQANEGGQLSYGRSSDNAEAWATDVFYNATEDVWRLIDMIAGQTRLMVDSSGRVGINQLATLTSPLDINGDCLRMRTQKTPASASAAGNPGEWCNDGSYFYVCTATNTWKRAALSAW